MKILLAICLLFVNGAFAARADYLWWQVTSSDVSAVYKGVVSGALLYGVSASGSASCLMAGTLGQTWAYDLTQSPLVNAFYVEVVRYDEATDTSEVVARSASNTHYSDVSSSISTSLSDVPIATAWNGGTLMAVPEPCSGLLLLAGAAGLSLRRRV